MQGSHYFLFKIRSAVSIFRAHIFRVAEGFRQGFIEFRKSSAKIMREIQRWTDDDDDDGSCAA